MFVCVFIDTFADKHDSYPACLTTSRWRMRLFPKDRLYIFLILTWCLGFPTLTIITSYLAILLTVSTAAASWSISILWLFVEWYKYQWLNVLAHLHFSSLLRLMTPSTLNLKNRLNIYFCRDSVNLFNRFFYSSSNWTHLLSSLFHENQISFRKLIVTLLQSFSLIRCTCHYLTTKKKRTETREIRGARLWLEGHWFSTQSVRSKSG